MPESAPWDSYPFGTKRAFLRCRCEIRDKPEHGEPDSAYVICPEAEAAMISLLQSRSRGLPAVVPCTVGVRELQMLGCRRIALMDLPWFDPELNNLGCRYYESSGFDGVFAALYGYPAIRKPLLLSISTPGRSPTCLMTPTG